MLSQDDHARVTDAVKRAESRTSGEILCVLSHGVSNYRETPLAWAIAASLIGPPIATAIGLHPWLLSQAGGDWIATNAVSLDASIRVALTSYAIAQAVIFTLVLVTVSLLRPLKMALTPKSLKRLRVRRAAMQQLQAAHRLGATAAVVIFAAEAERMVTVVADEAIHLKAGDVAWDTAVAAVLEGIRKGEAADGFVTAVDVCGGYLAEHFPADGHGRNLVEDGLIEI